MIFLWLLKLDSSLAFISLLAVNTSLFCFSTELNLINQYLNLSFSSFNCFFIQSNSYTFTQFSWLQDCINWHNFLYFSSFFRLIYLSAFRNSFYSQISCSLRFKDISYFIYQRHSLYFCLRDSIQPVSYAILPYLDQIYCQRRCQFDYLYSLYSISNFQISSFSLLISSKRSLSRQYF